MVEVGNRVSIASKKGGSRIGVVTAVSGSLVTVRWDGGEETSLIPGPGVLTVLRGRPRRPSGGSAAKKPAPTTPNPKTAARSTKATSNVAKAVRAARKSSSK
jgi:hypothetical protein